jgi:hypothetical protein
MLNEDQEVFFGFVAFIEVDVGHLAGQFCSWQLSEFRMVGEATSCGSGMDGLALLGASSLFDQQLMATWSVMKQQYLPRRASHAPLNCCVEN